MSFFKEKGELKTNLRSCMFLYFLWILSMVVFFLILFIFEKIDVSIKIWIFFMILPTVNVIGGIVIYVMLVTKILFFHQHLIFKWFELLVFITFIGFFLSLFNYKKIEKALSLESVKKEQTSSTNIKKENYYIASPTPTASPANKPKQKDSVGSPPISNKINCTGPDGIVFQTTQKECDDFNAAWGNNKNSNPNDELVNCIFNDRCGSKVMTRNDCNNQNCCQLKDGSWKIMLQSDCNAIINSIIEAIKTPDDPFKSISVTVNPSPSTDMTDLLARQKKDCLQKADTTYRSNLESCSILYSGFYKDENLKNGCEAKYYQQYIRDKGACN